MVGRGNGKFLNHAGMARAKIIQTTSEIGWYRNGNGTTRTIKRATTDQRGGSIPIALPDRKWMAARYSRVGKLIGRPTVEGLGGKVGSLPVPIGKSKVRGGKPTTAHGKVGIGGKGGMSKTKTHAEK